MDFVDRVFESLVIRSSDPQLVAGVVLDCFGDIWEGFTELPHYISEVVVHVDLYVDVGEVFRVCRAPEVGKDAETSCSEHLWP